MTYSVDNYGSVNRSSDSDSIFGLSFGTCVGVVVALNSTVSVSIRYICSVDDATMRKLAWGWTGWR